MRTLLFHTATACLIILFCAIAYADVNGDTWKGLPLAEAMSNALKAGKSMEAIVVEAIDAGADPVTVVKIAITLRADLAPVIVNSAVKLRPTLAAAILKAALEIQGVDSASVVTAAVTAVSDDVKAVTNLRFVALNAGIPQSIVDQAIGVVMGAPPGPVPTLDRAGTDQRGGYGGGYGGGQAPVASPSR